jgi:hypothetical protein
MLADFFLKRKIAGLVRRSHDVHCLDRYDSIAQLGRLPPTAESVACLIEHTRRRQQDSEAGIKAISALGMMKDRRATDHLVRLIRKEDGRIELAIKIALGQEHHASALPELAEMARGLCRNDETLFYAKCMVDLMRSIDRFASQQFIESLAPLVLESGLRELRDEAYTYARGQAAEEILAFCQQSSGRAALETFQDALAQHHQRKIMSAGQLGEIESSLEWLKKSNRPAAAAALAEFFRTPSRQVSSFDQREVSEYDSPNLAYESYERPCYTSELGQSIGPEEMAQHEVNTRARQAYEDAEIKRIYRENIYPTLLTHGDQQDLEDYAHACLTNPRYDIYLSDWRRDPGTPKLNNLSKMLGQAPDMPKAAELLRLIMAGDRTLLWASAREALARRGEYGGEIDWKPLAMELLERTGGSS